MKYILVAFIFYACNNNSNQKDYPKISVEALDTIKSFTETFVAKPELFEKAFIKGTTQKVNSSIINFYGVTIGKIKLTSGKIIACDPFLIEEYGIPFTQVFPTGEFPVQLSIGRLNDKESVAFARINFSDEPVEKWQFALQKGQPVIPFGGKEKYGYVVDAGIGLFMDQEANKALMKDTATLPEELYKEMDKHYRNHWKYAVYHYKNQNLAVFSAGFGDGYYATYIGFDAKGKACRLLTDFELFEWSIK